MLGVGAWLIAVAVGCSTGNGTGLGGMNAGDGGFGDGRIEAADGAGLGPPESDGAHPVPDAFVSAYVGPGSGGSAICGYAVAERFVQIGAGTIPQPVTFTIAELQSMPGTLSLSCKVDPSDSGFNVQLSAALGGPNGGSVSVAGLVTTEGGHNIQATVTSATGGSFTDANCSISFTYNGNLIPVMPPIAAGRIWGHLDCPEAKAPATPVTDGGPATCDAAVDFLFENCQ